MRRCLRVIRAGVELITPVYLEYVARTAKLIKYIQLIYICENHNLCVQLQINFKYVHS